MTMQKVILRPFGNGIWGRNQIEMTVNVLTFEEMREYANEIREKYGERRGEVSWVEGSLYEPETERWIGNYHVLEENGSYKVTCFVKASEGLN